MAVEDLLTTTDRGLYCARGDFFIDPWRPVPKAVVTHAHGDHISRGCGSCLCSTEGRGVLKLRLGAEAAIESIDYGLPTTINGVKVSLHPAGHIRGSAQIRVESQGEVWCVSGDYKVAPDPTCTPFEPVRCHTFVTESTFGLPIYRWRPAEMIWKDINDWWRRNQASGRTSVVFSYALGKAQRVLAGVDSSIGPIFCHGAVESINAVYRHESIALPATSMVSNDRSRKEWHETLVVAPPSARGTPWLRRFGDVSTGFVSGWMTVRGARRRRSMDRGFALSDHADWPGLIEAIRSTEASRVLVTHGSSAVMARWLNEQGIEAGVLRTRYEGELGEETETSEEAGDANGAMPVAAEAAE